MNHLSEIQLDRAALLHNLEGLRSLVPPHSKLAAVVKGNAYGHGMTEIVGMIDGKVDYFQVDDLDELRAFRKVSQSPVLVLGYVPLGDVQEAVALDAGLALYDLERIPALAAAAQATGKRPQVHLKIDALLGRQGVLPGDLGPILEELRRHPEIDLVAAYAHFANIEDTPDLGHALAQIETFDTCFQRIREAGWTSLGRHMSATSGLMAYETAQSPNDLVRVGVGLYGMYPSDALAATHAHLDLRPVMRWVTHLAQVKVLPAGHPVGYGLTYVASGPTRIGIVPQGYSDGFDRGLSGRGEVLVGGRRCPIVGRVAMNMFAVDLSSVPGAKAEDEVVLLGGQGDERITAEEIAAHIDTINYEVTTRVSPLLPRNV